MTPRTALVICAVLLVAALSAIVFAIHIAEQAPTTERSARP